MNVVMRFAKRDSNGVDIVREKIIPVKTFGTAHFNWHEVVATAVFHARKGERIVFVAEEGYS